jgi:hypothetical protein
LLEPNLQYIESNHREAKGFELQCPFQKAMKAFDEKIKSGEMEPDEFLRRWNKRTKPILKIKARLKYVEVLVIFPIDEKKHTVAVIVEYNQPPIEFTSKVRQAYKKLNRLYFTE